MRKYFFALIFGLWGYGSAAQNLHMFLSGGLMNYQGDLQSKRMTLDEAHPYVGIGAYYELSEKLFIRAGIINGKVSADDKFSKINSSRNLNFTSQLTELQLGLEYDLFNSNEHTITPYIFAAVAGFHFNPSTIDAAGEKVYLQPLGTEGQGFFNGRKKYALTQLAIPFGGGIKIAVSDNVFVRLDAGLRKLFTDYLDDVSTFYIDKASLLANNGQQAVDVAFRGDELNPTFTYPVQGAVRGNPKSKDLYYTGGISVSFRLTGNEYRGGGKGKGKLGCPVNVY
jgi:Domain of unknown function (DUF6089)